MSECVGVWVSECVAGWVGAWVSGCMGEWMRGCVGEWVSGWVGEWVSEWVSAIFPDQDSGTIVWILRRPCPQTQATPWDATVSSSGFSGSLKSNLADYVEQQAKHVINMSIIIITIIIISSSTVINIIVMFVFCYHKKSPRGTPKLWKPVAEKRPRVPCSPRSRSPHTED